LQEIQDFFYKRIFVIIPLLKDLICFYTKSMILLMTVHSKGRQLAALYGAKAPVRLSTIINRLKLISSFLIKEAAD
jgi:hypothetical protein